MRKFVLLTLLSTLFSVFFIAPAFAQTQSGSLREKRQDLRENVQQKRENLREQVQQRKKEFRKQLQTIRDQKKRAAVERINTKIANINKRRTDRMEKTLAKLRGILERISQKAEQAKTNGKDTTTVDVAITQAQTALSTTEATVNTQAAKQYTIQIESEEKLRSTVGTTVGGLQQDLRDTHKTVVDAKQKVQQAAKELAKLRGEKKTDEK